VVAPTVSLEDERQSKCGHIPDDRPNAVRRIDCRNAVLIAYKEQNDPGNLDIAHEYARAYKKAATDYRNGRIGQEQYTLRSEQARDAALKAEAERNEERRLAALAAPSVNQMNQTVWGSPH